jgi:hypothetical protein
MRSALQSEASFVLVAAVVVVGATVGVDGERKQVLFGCDLGRVGLFARGGAVCHARRLDLVKTLSER